jgi:hypothetical protein
LAALGSTAKRKKFVGQITRIETAHTEEAHLGKKIGPNSLLLLLLLYTFLLVAKGIKS